MRAEALDDSGSYLSQLEQSSTTITSKSGVFRASQCFQTASEMHGSVLHGNDDRDPECCLEDLGSVPPMTVPARPLPLLLTKPIGFAAYHKDGLRARKSTMWADRRLRIMETTRRMMVSAEPVNEPRQRQLMASVDRGTHEVDSMQPTSSQERRVVIIADGPAGLTAAYELSKQNVPAVIPGSR